MNGNKAGKIVDATDMHETVNKPWGYYKVLSVTDNYVIKELFIKAGQRLSLQRHSSRDEHWITLSGYGTLYYGAESDNLYSVNLSPSALPVKINATSWHRVEATSDLTIIEVWTGSRLSEFDIERIEDDYGRV